MENRHKEVETLLSELLSILEEDVTLTVEADTQDRQKEKRAED